MYALKMLAAAAALTVAAAAPAESLDPSDTPRHVGENATVCGLVASAKYANRSKGEPTFLNLGKPYPNQEFTAVIFGSDRAKFGAPEVSMRGKQLCVTGDMRLYRGSPKSSYTTRSS